MPRIFVLSPVGGPNFPGQWGCLQACLQPGSSCWGEGQGRRLCLLSVFLWVKRWQLLGQWFPPVGLGVGVLCPPLSRSSSKCRCLHPAAGTSDSGKGLSLPEASEVTIPCGFELASFYFFFFFFISLLPLILMKCHIHEVSGSE